MSRDKRNVDSENSTEPIFTSEPSTETTPVAEPDGTAEVPFGLLNYVGAISFARPQPFRGVKKTSARNDSGQSPVADVTITFPALGIKLESAIWADVETRADGSITMSNQNFSLRRGMRALDSDADENSVTEFREYVLSEWEMWQRKVGRTQGQSEKSKAHGRLIRAALTI